MPELLRMVLGRWHSTSPLIGADELEEQPEPWFRVLHERTILRPAASSPISSCIDCGKRCPVRFLTDDAGMHHGYIHCNYCGLNEVPLESLQRWEINSHALLTAAFPTVRRSLQEHVPGQLWQIGKAQWAGRTREVWLIRSYQREQVSAVMEILKSRPKALVFCPLEATVIRWQEILTNPLLALETTLSVSTEGFEFDTAYVEDQLVDPTSMSPAKKSIHPVKKTARMLANIARLRDAVIAHIKSAQRHAFAHLEATGVAELLPRPTQLLLGGMVGLKDYEVTRCLDHKAADELRLYWFMAEDLDEILRWSGPIRIDRKK